MQAAATDDLSTRGAVAEVWRIAWPTVLTMVSYTIMQFVDALMVAQLGPVEVAAQGNGGVWSWAVIFSVVGVLTVVNTFVSQAVGAQRPHEVARYAWAGVWLALVAYLVILLPLGLLLPSMRRQQPGEQGDTHDHHDGEPHGGAHAGSSPARRPSAGQRRTASCQPAWAASGSSSTGYSEIAR